MDFTPHTPEEIERMLATVGAPSLEALFDDIPPRFRLGRPLDLPSPLSEQELAALMTGAGGRNTVPDICLMGAGAYRHYIPAVVGHVLARPEFYTAYTPYQAEISQGLLQAMYEYQTLIARLSGMQVANASMYDGASALAEAAVLAARTVNRKRIVLARSLHPEYRQVVRTYAWANGYDVEECPWNPAGQLDGSALRALLDAGTAAVLIQSPNFFGVVENLTALAPTVHGAGALLVASFTEALSLGLLKSPGEAGADLVVGEGQSLGIPLHFGGPYLGILAGTEAFLRKIPGRLAGATTDREGRRGFVLTLQTREQHIRREKASSNICSNEALCALAAAVYLVCLGKNLQPRAELNLRKAHYLKTRLSRLPGWSPVFSGPTFNEFLLHCPDPDRANGRLLDAGILGGYDGGRADPALAGTLLLCATELLSRAEMDRVADILKDA